MANITLALLGPFQATLGGLPVEGLTSDRLRALLAFLAVESGREHSRQAVACLLWPERSDREALGALRYALSNLRHALGDQRSPSPFLLVTRTSVQFNADSDHCLDIAEFEGLRGRLDVPSLERAASIYRGPFLDGLSVGDSPALDEWILLTGEAYRRKLLSVLGHLTALQMSRGEGGEAARWARRQLELEPYREQAHRQLMMALALGGERAAALAHYEACRRMLAAELGCEPDDETQALCAQIREGALSHPGAQPQRSPATLSAPELARSTYAAVKPSRTAPIGTTAGQARRAGSGSAPPTAGPKPPFSPLPTRSTSAGYEPSSPLFVARERELARLHGFLEGALNGEGGVALITGEAGSGKTALMDTFARQASQAHGDLIALRGRCNAHGGAGDPYLPVREILRTLAGDVERKRPSGTLSLDQARRVRDALPAVGAALVELGPDLIDTFVPGEPLLQRVEGFPGPQAGRPPGTARWLPRLREIIQRAGEVAGAGADPGAVTPQPDLFAQVTRVLDTVSMTRSLLLTIDDLQWVDSGTAALLFHLGRRLAGSRILLVCAYRPGALNPQTALGPSAGEANQAAAPGIAAILEELTRVWGDVLVDLDDADGRAFVEAYVDSEPNRLGTAFRQALHTHTVGNPLFTVELMRSFEREGMLVQDEAGQWIEAARLDWGRWPPRVEAVIAGHMACLRDEDRLLLQVASVQGEQFTAEVAVQVLGWDEEAAVRRLSGPLRTQHRLVEAVSLDRLASSGQRLSRYRFRHALLGRSAYASLDVVARGRLHEATARALEAVYAAEGEQPQALAPELARHYEEAGMPLEAARHRLEAGRWAVRLVAYDEATAHFARGLALLEDAPPSHERLRLELGLWVAMNTPLMMQRGVQAPAYTQALERLSDLVQHPDLQDDPQRLAALTVLALSAGWSADPVRTGRVGQQLLDLARSEGSGQAQDGDQQTLLLGHWALGFSHWLRGQPVPAFEHLSRALVLYNPDANRPLGGLVAADPGVMARAMLGAVQWQLGYPDQARACFHQAVAQGQALEQPSSVAFAHYIAAMASSAVGCDAEAALRHAEALRPLGRVSVVYRAWAETLAGQVQAQCGQADAGAAEPGPEQGLARVVEAGSSWEAAGSGGGYAGMMLVQAEVCARAGQIETGLRAIDQAQAWIERTGMQATQADTWRMRGELLLIDRPDRSGQVEEAEACFERALELARERQARLFELRAAVRLARLWGSQGRRHEARDLLGGIYGWFTEGFDSPDLVEAKALLEELG